MFVHPDARRPYGRLAMALPMMPAYVVTVQGITQAASLLAAQRLGLSDVAPVVFGLAGALKRQDAACT